MKLKTSIAIITGCLFIFLFIMLPIFLSVKNKDDNYVASFKENSDPLYDATYSSFFSCLDKKIGNIINKKINKQPLIIVIDVFSFIIDILLNITI